MTHIEEHCARPPDKCYLSLMHGYSKNGELSHVARTIKRASSAGESRPRSLECMLLPVHTDILISQFDGGNRKRQGSR